MHDEISRYVFDGNVDKTKDKIHVLSGIIDIENIFTIEDMKLVDEKISPKKEVAQAIGESRKVLFSKLFFEKVKSGKIKIENLSDNAKKNFSEVFNWIKDRYQ